MVSCYHFLISVSVYLSLDQLTTVLVCFLLKLMCTVDDLKEMGIPLGPRKKIANFVKQKAAKLVKFISALKIETQTHLLVCILEVCADTGMVRPAGVLLAQGHGRVDGGPDFWSQPELDFQS